MSVLELAKDALCALSDSGLEQLIGRLAEAEVVAQGASLGDVRFSGAITAPDDGVDVRVDVKISPFKADFIPRANTIFQAKKPRMPAGAITKEMKPKGTLLAMIGKQAEIAGAYIIVSLEDDCTEKMRNDRLQAMTAALDDHPNKDAIHLDFFDRGKLHQWLRQHPGVMLWVRGILSKPLSGWRSYGKWSSVPAGVSDDLILAPGVSVILPSRKHQKLTIEQAITPTRRLIAASDRAIRVTGLSGVGKTRFVQALFDETIGEDALDRTAVVYVNTGADPDPSAHRMIDQLLTQDGRAVTMVIDNCSSALHSELTNQISSSKNRIKLITVEYDIREDKPLTTEVIHIEANRPEIAEKLVLRRYPEIGRANARRVAKFASGNAQVALALADPVEDGESLAHLSDAYLFDRLFQQRHGEDGPLRKHAEILSLVYSFAVEAENGAPDELAVLGSLCSASADQLFDSAQTLLDRQIAQERSRWRAILPQAIGNRLAASALKRVRILILRKTFENPTNNRLLMSFAHRLGLLHDHPVAQKLVRAWLSEGGMLVPVFGLDDSKVRILEYVAPVCPDLLLDRIEAEILASEFNDLEVSDTNQRTTILNMLVSLAYEPQAFDRCIKLLLRVAKHEDPANNHDSVHDKIVQFYQPYLSGTHASPGQRAEILRASLWSGDPTSQALGVKMLSKTLGDSLWMGMGMGDFGARPRDFGFEPNAQQLVAWRHLFMDIAVEAGLGDNHCLSDQARELLAQQFRGLWYRAAVRGKLIEAAKTLNDKRPWIDGWKAVQSTIYFYYRMKAGDTMTKSVPLGLTKLRDLLAPKDLVTKIKTYLFVVHPYEIGAFDPDVKHDDQNNYQEAEAELLDSLTNFGEQFASSNMAIDQLGSELFTPSQCSYRGRAFGQGLAKGSRDITATWAELVSALEQIEQTTFDYTVMMTGFIEEARLIDPALVDSLLDACLDNPRLRSAIMSLHPSQAFSESDLDRCMRALEHLDVSAYKYDHLLWRPEFAALPTEKILKLANMLLQKPNGDDALLGALSMKLDNSDLTIDTLGLQLRRIGLIASINRLTRDWEGNTTMVDYYMAAVIASCLTHDGNENEKSGWLDTIFSCADKLQGYMPDYENAIQKTAEMMPEAFLDRVFSGDEKQELRCRFLKEGGIRRSVLATTDVGRISEWCRAKGGPVVWQVVACALPVFATRDDDKIVTLSDISIQLLESSLFPEQVLMGYAHRITPNSCWSGSRAEIMERNTNALAVLLRHNNPAISGPAEEIVSKAKTCVAKEREHEHRKDEAREQSFE